MYPVAMYFMNWSFFLIEYFIVLPSIYNMD